MTQDEIEGKRKSAQEYFRHVTDSEGPKLLTILLKKFITSG